MTAIVFTLAWTRATVEDAQGRTVAIVERSAVNPERWHLHRLTTGNPPRYRESAVETFETWAALRDALTDRLDAAGALRVDGDVITLRAAAGATATHDYLRTDP